MVNDQAMTRSLLATLAAAATLAAFPATAETIDFETTPVGTYADGTVIGGVTLGTALGNGFSIGNYGVQSDGRGLAVFNDTNGNFLTGSLSGSATSISFDFGNDDPFFTNAGDLATLKLFNGLVQVGLATVVLNRDDVINQTIDYTGAAFNNFTFAYTDAAGNPFTGGGTALPGLTEVVDNFRIDVAGVPEPSTWALMILGFGAVGGAIRRASGRENGAVLRFA